MTMVVGCSGVQFDLPQHTDHFSNAISYNNKVDILWLVDDSSSMEKHQRSLDQQIPALVTTLNGLKMDYHIGVITSSVTNSQTGGRLLGEPRFLTQKTPNMLTLLRQRMLAGELGSNLERSLDAMEIVLSPRYQSEEGKGFLRDDALLVVIALSDEEDHSPVSNPVAHFTSFLDSIKAPWVDGSRSWVFNFIGVLDESATCRTFNDYSSVGNIFKGLVDISGGIKESICTSSLDRAVKNIRARIYEIITDYKLSKKPIVETIRVRLGGVEIPRSQVDGWDYIEATNVVRFYGSAVPAADVSISVDFKPSEAN